MTQNVKKVLVKFNEASEDNVAKGNLVPRGMGISRESEGVWIKTETGDFLFLPSEESLMDDGASRIGVSSATLTGTVKSVLENHQATLQGLGSLSIKSDIGDVDVRSDAAIAWSKISKSGASALDIGGAPVVGGKIPAQYIPSVAVDEVFSVASEAAMLSLDAQVGDYCVRTDLGKKYMLVGTASVLADWVPVGAGGDVLSVDGRSGVVTLSDLYKPIGYVPTWSEITSKPTTLAGFGITDAVHNTGAENIDGKKNFRDGIKTDFVELTNVGLISPAVEGTIEYDGANAYLGIADEVTQYVDPNDGKVYDLVTVAGVTFFKQSFARDTANSWSPFGSLGNVATMGRIYTHAQALANCPAGYHLITNAEIDELAAAVGGGLSLAGYHLKATTGWTNVGDDSIGFRAFAASYYSVLGSTYGGIDQAYFWTSDVDADPAKRIVRYLGLDGSLGQNGYAPANYGFSVRYVKD